MHVPAYQPGPEALLDGILELHAEFRAEGLLRAIGGQRMSHSVPAACITERSPVVTTSEAYGNLTFCRDSEAFGVDTCWAAPRNLSSDDASQSANPSSCQV